MSIAPYTGLQILPFAGIVNPNASGIVITGADPTLSLDLNFLSSASDNLYSFTRASSATDIINGVLTTFASGVRRRSNSNGLLIEESRTNIYRQSSIVADGPGTSLTTNVADPSGGTGAVTLNEGVGATFKRVGVATNYVSYTTGVTHTISFFVKPGTQTLCQIHGDATAFAGIYANFQLTGAGSVTASSGTVAQGAQQLANGWYRVWMIATTNGTNATAGAAYLGHINSTTATRNPSYTGTGLTMDVFGGQVEAGAFMTSYIPTTTASVTRAADEVSINPISWFNANTGTFVVEARTGFAVPSTTARLMRVRDSLANNFIEINYNTAGTAAGLITSGGVGQANLVSVGTWGTSTTRKAGIAYALNNVAFSLAGAAPVTTATATMPVAPDTLRIGASASNAGFLNGYIRRLSYYNVRKSNAELQALTT